MRTVCMAAWLAACVLLPSLARAQTASTTEVQGFGGLTFGTSALGSFTSSTYGGRVAFGLGDNMQAIGEGGRMTDIKSPLLDLTEFAPFGVRVSAWYGEGGVRFITSPRSAVRPYGEATAGFARLSTGLSGVNGTPGAMINAGLNFLNRTEPMLGAGGGIVVQGGALSLDLGYRYNKILAGNSVASALNLGQDFSVNQFRIGLGVRF